MLKRKSCLVGSCIVISTMFSHAFAQDTKKPNILFIAIDDLKPELGCYGNKLIKTPNIDKLAAMGTVFLSNYCQQSVCGPTRASLLTGKRPDYTQVWDLKAKIRSVNPQIVTLPQYFISQGYSTQGIGKVYDPRNVDKFLDKPSWSVPFYEAEESYFDKQFGLPALGQYQLPATKALAKQYQKEAADKGLRGKEASQYVIEKVRPSTECVDVPDNAYDDGANALKAKDVLVSLSKSDKPFFFAVGFHKPHLPFVAPKKYWDLYQQSEMPVASYQEKAKNGVDMAYHTASEMKLYSDIPALTSFTDQKSFGLTLPVAEQQHLIHGYYAGVSYTDALVGSLLQTLDSLHLTSNTIIVLWGDHGWHLGDHNLWCKHTNFEQSTHAPLIISAPGISPSRTKSVSEFIDIFPTLCQLSGAKIPDSLDGKSLVPIMKKPSTEVHEFAVSQYPRSSIKVETERLGYANTSFMGYSIRNKRYRYTLWLGNDYRSTKHFKDELVVGAELYDYDKDPNETINVAKEKSYGKVAQKMNEQMITFLKNQEKK